MHKRVYTSTYAYLRVQTVLYAFKMVQTGLEPAIFCILLAEVAPSLRGFGPERRNISSAGIYIHTHCHCNTAGLCTWCLMPNRWLRSRSAAAPGLDIPRPSLDLDRSKAQMCILARLRGCYVLADGSPIQKEAVT